jgi:transposase
MFVPLAVVCEAEPAPDCGTSVEASLDAAGMMTVELGADVVVRIAGDVPLDRAAALVRALRGAA